MALDDRILNAKNDPSEMENLIKEYTPFIKATISKTLKKYIQSEDASLTTGMMAFHESILKFDPSKGSFISYAQIVIRSRVLDELRYETKYEDRVKVALDTESNDELIDQAFIKHSISEFENRKVEDQRKDDLIVYMEVLKSWDLTMEELVKVSPKKKALLELYQSIGKFIASQPDLLKNMRSTKRVPSSVILETFEIDRKRLDRGRKYIIAVTELWAGDFETLKSYLGGR